MSWCDEPEHDLDLRLRTYHRLLPSIIEEHARHSVVMCRRSGPRGQTARDAGRAQQTGGRRRALGSRMPNRMRKAGPLLRKREPRQRMGTARARRLVPRLDREEGDRRDLRGL